MDIEHHLIMDSEGAKPIISRAVAQAIGTLRHHRRPRR